MYDQRGGYKLLYYTRGHAVQTLVLISPQFDLHIDSDAWSAVIKRQLEMF